MGGITDSIVQQASAQPQGAPAIAPASQSMQAGLDSVGTGALTPAQLAAQLGEFQRKGQAQEADFNKQYAALPQASLPESKFSPIPHKDMSLVGSMMMILGALAGQHTMNPLAAALNNMTGIMKGQKEGNDEMIAAQREQFKSNLDAGMARAKQVNEEHRTLLEKHNYDTKARQEEFNIFKLQHGIGDGVSKESMFNLKERDNLIKSIDDRVAAAGKAQQAHQENLAKMGSARDIAMNRDIDSLSNKWDALIAKALPKDRPAMEEKRRAEILATIARWNPGKNGAPAAASMPPKNPLELEM